VEAYQAITGTKNMVIGEAVITVETGQPVEEYETLLNILNDFEYQQGWLCYQSAVLVLPESDRLPTREDKILHGELVKGNESLHIQLTDNRWWITRIIEGNGEQCLIKKQCYCISENEFADYHVYWKYRDNGYQADSYRFVGFSNKKGAS
jgi:hypothetical protein